MIQVGTMVALTVLFLKKESDAFVLQRGFLFDGNGPWANQIYGRSTPWTNQIYGKGNDYESEARDIILPVQFVSAGEFQLESNLSYDIIQSDDGEQTGFLPTEKRVPVGYSTVSKRIHTCAFMRRLGLPIGLCFNRTGQKPKVPEKDENPGQAAYAYLERQWPVHSMLGGGVGR